MARAGSSADQGGTHPEENPGRATRARLGRPPTRTRAEVVAAAIAIADAEGLAAVSMRRVAADLGAGVMSLYTYVPDKENLVELMIDEVVGEQELPGAASTDWRAELLHLARGQRELMLRHPWLPTALSIRQALGPNVLAHLEYTLGVLEPTGLDGQTRLEVIALLTGFVAIQVGHELAEARAVQRTGVSTEQMLDERTRRLRAAAESGKYPQFARILATADRGRRSPAPDFDRLAERMINGLVGGPGA
jgi:AcrR family transcriptional regulator